MKPSPKTETQKDFCYTHYLNPEADIHPVFVRFDYNSGRENFDYTLHRHVDHELVYVDEGVYLAELNGQRVQLPAGAALLVCPGDEHSDNTRPGLKYYTLSFFVRRALGKRQELRLLQAGLGLEQKVFRNINPVIRQTMREAADVMQRTDPGSAHLAHSLLQGLFWRFVLEIPQERYSTEFFRLSEPDNFARQFYQVLQNSPAQMPELADIAEQLAISPSQLSKLCKRHLKNSPGQLVQQFHINRASELLAKSNLSIREISEILGFKDQFTLSRSFKRLTGYTPMAYRKNRQEDADMEVSTLE